MFNFDLLWLGTNWFELIATQWRHMVTIMMASKNKINSLDALHTPSVYKKLEVLQFAAKYSVGSSLAQVMACCLTKKPFL